MPEIVFNIVPKYPKEEHVSCNMQKAAVKEHAGDQGNKRCFKADMAIEKAADVRGDRGVGHHKSLVLRGRQRQLKKEYDDVRQNEESIDDGVGPAGVQVFERDEHSLVWLLQSSVSRVGASHPETQVECFLKACTAAL